MHEQPEKTVFAVKDLVTWNGQQGIVTAVYSRGAAVFVLFLDGNTREFTRRPVYNNVYVLRGKTLPSRKTQLVHA